MPTRRPGPAVAKRQLRLQLRRGRNEANLTQNDIADKLGWSPSKILRLENGQTPFQVSDVVALLTLYPSLRDKREELTALAWDARKPTLANRYSDIISPVFGDWLEHEAYASRISQYENIYIPGVLQTGDYATGIIDGLLGGAEERRTRMVDARIERAEALIGPDGPRMEFIVDEAAARRAVGNEDGTRGFAPIIEQLHHLQRYNTVGRRANGESVEEDLNPNISVQIVPSSMGAYAAMRGPFEVLEFPGSDDEPMVFFEGPEGDEVVRDDKDRIGRYLDLFATLKKAVAGPEKTNAYLDTIITQLSDLPADKPEPPPGRRSRKVTAAV